MVCNKAVRIYFGIGLALAASMGMAHAACNAPVGNSVTCTGGNSAHVGPYTNNGAFTTMAADHFPAALTVTGAPGGSTVTGISLTVHGYTAAQHSGSSTTNPKSSRGMGLLLSSPSNHNLEIMRSVGDPATAESNLAFSISDAAGSAFPDSGCAASGSMGSGPFKPSAYHNCSFSNAAANYAAAGAPALQHSAPTDGTGTLANVFMGDTVLGNWNLYLVDNDPSADVQFTSWDITISYSVASNPSTTTLTPNPPTAYKTAPGNTILLTAAMTSGATGTVTFKDGGSNLTCAGGNPANVSSNQAVCSTSFSTEGVHVLSANYSGDGSFQPSSGSANVFIQNHAGNSGTTYCNTGAITNNGKSDLGYTNTSPYPSVIFIGDGVNADIANSVNTVSVTLKNFSSVTTISTRMLLVAPDGAHAYDFWSHVGGGASAGDFNIVDGSPQIPNVSTIPPGTYAPTADGAPPDIFTPGPPAPAPQLPGSFFYATPEGDPNSKTFQTAFVGAAAHGAWSLFLFNDAGSTATTQAAGGWCLTISPAAGFPTTVTVMSNPVLATQGSSVTFTANVASSGHPTPNQGTVTFTENGSPLAGAPNGGVANVVNGVAMISTTGLPEGDHTISAEYHDSMGTYNDNFNTVQMRVDHATNTPTLLGNTWSYCNPGAITIPRGVLFVNDTGAGTPNPSNVFVTNLFGTINTVGLTLKQFTVFRPSDLESLLVGPNGLSAPTTSQTLDFFSQTGGINTYGPATTKFSDSGSVVPANSPPSGNNAPTSRVGASSYTASPFFTLPGTFQYPTTNGGFTFDTGNAGNPAVYKNTLPNGTWSLYFDQLTHSTGSGVNSGWCVDFVENPVVVTVTKGHIGNQAMNHFIQGEQGAKFTVDIHNQGPGPTADPDGLHPLTVTDTLASDFTPGTLPTGSPWDCTAALQVVTCKEHGTIAQGGDYPQLIIPVNVSNTAGASAMNTASASGIAISDGPSGSDTVIIDPAPVLSLMKTHNGTFSDGQTNAEWDITVNNTPVGSITSGTTNVSDTLPAGYTISSITASGWSCGGSVGTGTLSCTSTAVISGGSSFPVIQMFVSIPINAGTPVSNTAKTWGGGDLNHVSSGTAASGSDNNVPVILLANLSITKAHVGTNFSQGQQGAQYTIVVSNGGGGATGASAVTVMDTLPTGLTVAGTSSAGWSCTGTTTASCSYTPSIPAGGTATLTLNVNVATTAGTPLSNAATVSCTCTQSSPNNNTSNTDMVTVTQLADLIVSKTHSPSSFTVNDQNDTFSVLVTNQGFAATTGTVTVTDMLPAGLTFNGTSTAGWMCNANGSNPVICSTTNTIASGGGNTTLVLKVNVASSTNPTLTNNVSVACTCTESTTNNNSNTDMVTVIQVVNIILDTLPTGLMVSSDGGQQFTAPHTYQFAPNSTHTIATASPQPGGSGTQFVFLSWSDGMAQTHTITTPAVPTTYTATFKTQFQLTTGVAPGGSGTVTPPTGSFFDSGTMVTVQAFPSSGYTFSSWTGNVADASANPTTVTMSAPQTVTANMTAPATSELIFIAGKSGTRNGVRVWTLNNTNGNGPVNALTYTSFTLAPAAGTTCSPVATGASVNGGINQPFPVLVGNLAPGAVVSVAVSINFTGCVNTSKFTLTMPYTGNAGATTGALVTNGQFQ